MTSAPNPMECRHGLNPEWCTYCNGGPMSPADELHPADFYARYEGPCDRCADRIQPGELVRYLGGALMHSTHFES